VKIIGEAPLVKNIAGRHGIEVGGFAVHSSGKRVVVCATIDNLLKGAATQCLRKSSRPVLFERTDYSYSCHREHEPRSRLRRVRGHSSRVELSIKGRYQLYMFGIVRERYVMYIKHRCV
jgi:hypothetical protein